MTKYCNNNAEKIFATFFGPLVLVGFGALQSCRLKQCIEDNYQEGANMDDATKSALQTLLVCFFLAIVLAFIRIACFAKTKSSKMIPSSGQCN